MTPREFYNRYGLPSVKRVDLGLVVVPICTVNPDRYLLMFCPGDVSFTFRPSLPEVTNAAFTAPNNTQQVIYTHALHGALVNLGWEAFSGVGGSVTVYEGVMQEGSVFLSNLKQSKPDLMEEYIRFVQERIKDNESKKQGG